MNFALTDVTKSLPQIEVETPDGQTFDITFVKGDKGKITKMILGAGEMEFEAPRIKEDKKEKRYSYKKISRCIYHFFHYPLYKVTLTIHNAPEAHLL